MIKTMPMKHKGPRNYFLKVRMTSKEKEKVKHIAENLGLDISSYVRKRLCHDQLIKDDLVEMRKKMEALHKLCQANFQNG